MTLAPRVIPHGFITTHGRDVEGAVPYDDVEYNIKTTELIYTRKINKQNIFSLDKAAELIYNKEKCNDKSVTNIRRN